MPIITGPITKIVVGAQASAVGNDCWFAGRVVQVIYHYYIYIWLPVHKQGMQGKAFETTLRRHRCGASAGNNGLIIIKIFNAVEIGNLSVSFVHGVNLKDPVAMSFGNPKRVVGTISNFPWKAHPIPVVRGLAITRSFVFRGRI